MAAVWAPPTTPTTPVGSISTRPRSCSTELVTNAVLHAGTELEVLVSVRPGRLRLAVADRGSDAPSVTRATADDEHGRGLALVDALTLRWGIVPRGPAGKVVWAVLGPDEVVGPSAALPVASDGRS